MSASQQHNLTNTVAVVLMHFDRKTELLNKTAWMPTLASRQSDPSVPHLCSIRNFFYCLSTAVHHKTIGDSSTQHQCDSCSMEVNSETCALEFLEFIISPTEVAQSLGFHVHDM